MPLPRAPKIEKTKIAAPDWADGHAWKTLARPIPSAYDPPPLTWHPVRDRSCQAFLGALDADRTLLAEGGEEHSRVLIRHRRGGDETLWEGGPFGRRASVQSPLFPNTNPWFFRFANLPGGRFVLAHPAPGVDLERPQQLTAYSPELEPMDTLTLPKDGMPKKQGQISYRDLRFLAGAMVAAVEGRALVLCCRTIALLVALEPKMGWAGKGTVPDAGRLVSDGDRVLSSSDTSFRKVRWSELSNLEELLERHAER
jgi:hypothetical protein